MTKVIIGNHEKMVAVNAEVVVDYFKSEKLTGSLYTLCNNSLLKMEFINGNRVKVKLFNSSEVDNVMVSVHGLKDVEYFYI